MNKLILSRMMNDIVRLSGSDAAISLEDHFPGGRLIGGKYVMNTHSVTMYLEVIKKQCMIMFGSLDRVHEYFAVVFAHELGHAADQMLAILAERQDETQDELEGRQIALQIEENAWNNAWPWLTNIDEAFVKAIIDRSLEAYREPVIPVTA